MTFDPYPNFTESEFRCRCGCGAADMQPAFMQALQDVRSDFGKPMTITSGYRCETHNKAVGGGPEHPTGWAADIAVSNPDAMFLVGLAVKYGFDRIGVSQKSGRPRFIHLGMSPDMPAAIWSY